MPRKRSQVQKHSKYISKTVHVTSVAQLQFRDATRILFILWKENKNKNLLNYSPPSYVVHHFGEYHAYTRFPWSVNNAYYTDYVHAHAFPPNVNNAYYTDYVHAHAFPPNVNNAYYTDYVHAHAFPP